MEENLVIVESPAKAKTLEKFLGKGYTVASSYGHIRDLSSKDFGIDVKNGFSPNYIIPDEKKKVVADLKEMTKKAKTVWLASDEDREGEAIAWHLCEVLGLNERTAKRIVFHEITKPAILEAIKNPRTIDKNLVNAQQARRVLDRIVGFELSPVLWKKIKPALSAGRVQSVALRLIVEREREIISFQSSSSFRVVAHFIIDGTKNAIVAELQERLSNKEATLRFLEQCKDAKFSIADIQKKPAKKMPAAPFTTSTLQQEASRKLGFSVSQTMTIAQKLYEAGKITYMRTDSVNLSNTILSAAKEVISKEFGKNYLHIRQYATKTKGAQEAHEAIRPTYLDQKTIAGSNNEKRLYDLIWKRTVASQMKEAQLEKTTATICISNNTRKFVAEGEVLLFDGFLKVYSESNDDDTEDNVTGKMLPPLKTDDVLNLIEINASERFANHPPRYTEASLVRKLEELGIGRPSTYAPTISTIQNRGYVTKESRAGEERTISIISLKNGQIKEQSKKENYGAEKNKLFPNDIGMVVSDFLMQYFEEIMNYNFTAKVEKEFDEIAEGKIEWNKMISKFYKPFHNKVEEALKVSEKTRGKRKLGIDPKTGKPVFVLIGRYGPMVQIGDKDSDEKPKFSSLLKNQYIENITLEEALKLFELPRVLGQYENTNVVVNIGRFGPYINHNKDFISLDRTAYDPYTITFEQAIPLILEKREANSKKEITVFEGDPPIRVLNGRFGPYIARGKENFKIPKDKKPESLSLNDCLEIIKAKEEGVSVAKNKKKKSKK